jgi:predicted 3-demethylubiquinone-9 3-methyltransferase (glyoxalase superfamily)
MIITQKITPTLFFDSTIAKTEDVITFYSTVFKDFEVIQQTKLPAGPADGKTLAQIKMNGLEFTIFAAGPDFKFSEAFSLTIECQSQEDVDYYWEKLTDGGKKIECGWLQDRFGVFWQIVPRRLMELIQDKNQQKAARVFNAMLHMKKINIAELEKASQDS